MNWQRGLGLGVLLSVALACAYVTGSVTAQRPLVTSDEINTVEVTRAALPATVRIDSSYPRRRPPAGREFQRHRQRIFL